jgi:hypothetical protein
VRPRDVQQDVARDEVDRQQDTDRQRQATEQWSYTQRRLPVEANSEPPGFRLTIQPRPADLRIRY